MVWFFAPLKLRFLAVSFPQTQHGAEVGFFTLVLGVGCSALILGVEPWNFRTVDVFRFGVFTSMMTSGITTALTPPVRIPLGKADGGS